MKEKKSIVIFFDVILLLYYGFRFYIVVIRPEYVFHSVINSKWYQKANINFEKMPVKNGTIIFLGNSLTEQFDFSDFQNEKIENRGISGDFTKGVLLRIGNVIQSKPSKIFIEIGVNDILAGYSAKEILNNYQLLILEIKEKLPNTKIYIQSILPVFLQNTFYISNKEANKKIQNVNEGLKKKSIENNAVFVNLHEHFFMNGKLNSDFTTDGVHLTKKGYKKWKEIIEPYVNI